MLLATAALALLAGALLPHRLGDGAPAEADPAAGGAGAVRRSWFHAENGPAAWGRSTIIRRGWRARADLFRALLLLSVSLLVVMTTRERPRALDNGAAARALSHLLTAPLNLIDGIADEAAAIRDSLQVRGLSARSGLAARVRLLGAMLAPLVRDMIAEAGTRAEALDARGFRAPPRRSLLDPLTENPGRGASAHGDPAGPRPCRSGWRYGPEHARPCSGPSRPAAAAEWRGA